MKALILEDHGTFALRDIDRPALRDGDVVVRVRAAAICGSDVHGMDGSTGRRRPPIVMGHEAAGDIVEAGAGVREYHPGDRVTFDSTEYRGTCWHCRRGEVNLCDDRRVLGVSCAEYRRDGADRAFEAVGAAAPVKTAIAAVRKGGTATLIGNASPAVELPLQDVVTRKIGLLESCAISGEYPVALDLMARGKVDARALVSAIAPLAEGAAWFERLHRREPGLLKVVLEP